MKHRYAPENINCEAFDYAKKRAAIFFKFHRKRYCGELGDLQQIAMMAVVEAVNKNEDKTTIEDEQMLDVVEKALTAAIRQTPMQSFGESKDREEMSFVESEVVQHDDRNLHLFTIQQLDEFQTLIRQKIGQSGSDILWKHYILGKSLEEIQSEMTMLKKPSIANIRRMITEATIKLRESIPPKVIDEIAKLRLQ